MKIFYVFFTMLTSLSLAEEELEQILNHNTYQPNYFSMLFGLLFVIALIYLTGIMYKKLTKVKLDNSIEDKYEIQLISSASLGQNKNLYIIKTNNKYSLIAATQNSISYLRDIDEFEEQAKECSENNVN